MPYTRFEQIFFNYFEQFKRLMDATPLVLGGVSGAGGGTGGRPGGFVGYLPQTDVAYDMSEAESLYVPESGASLLDNLNHIRYRLNDLELAELQEIFIYENGVPIASGVYSIDFLTDNIVETSAGHISVSGNQITFLDLPDTPNSYSGQANKYLTVNGGETAVEFITLGSGDSFKAKVSSDDTTENFLENKIVAGNGVLFNTLNPGGNEQIEITITGSVIVHGSLLGLSSDDHTQYFNETRHGSTVFHELGTVVPHDNLDGLSDVIITTPIAGEALVYTGTNWVNDTISGLDFTIDIPPIMTIFTVDGNLEVNTGKLRIYNQYGISRTITKVFLSVSTPPVGASVIVDINKSGTTIFSNQTHRPQITPGNYTGQTTVIDTAGWNDGEYLTMDVDQVGSTTSGSYLTVHIVHI